MNGKDLPPEFRELPAGRHVVQAVEEEAPTLATDEETGIEAALESYRQNRVIDAKRARQIIDTAQALDALDNLRRGGDGANGSGKPANDAEIETIVEVPDDLMSQSRHSLLLQGSPTSGRLLIPLARRDGRVVEGARLEIALAICDGVLQISITVAKPTT